MTKKHQVISKTYCRGSGKVLEQTHEEFLSIYNAERRAEEIRWEIKPDKSRTTVDVIKFKL